MSDSTRETVGQAVRKLPPPNPIIGQKRADKWDSQIDGLIIDVDRVAKRADNNSVDLAKIRAELISMDLSIDSWRRNSMIRDIVKITLLVAILIIISYNTSQLWNWG